MHAFMFVKTFLVELNSYNMRCTYRLLVGNRASARDVPTFPDVTRSLTEYSLTYAPFISMKTILQAHHIYLTMVVSGISIWSQCFQGDSVGGGTRSFANAQDDKGGLRVNPSNAGLL